VVCASAAVGTIALFEVDVPIAAAILAYLMRKGGTSVFRSNGLAESSFQFDEAIMRQDLHGL